MTLTLEEQRRLLDEARPAAGDPARRRLALAALLDDFRRPALAAIHRTLAAGGLGREHAEEALQAATLKLLAGGLERFRGESAPRTYFVRIAIHAAVDLVRLLQRERELGLTPDAEAEADVDAAAPATGPAERALQRRQEREALERCLEELPPGLRQAITLYYLGDGEDCRSCARRVGVGKNTFEQRLCRGRLALALCLRQRQVLPDG
jgi:RNA polymerase sigma factor (sigma-70 family)